MTTPRRIAVILPYAVAIRDFVHSGVLGRLLATDGVAVTIYTLNPDLPELAEARANGANIRAFTPYRDTREERFLKHLYLYAFADEFVYIQQMLATRPMRRTLAGLLCGVRRTIGTARFLRLFERVMLALFRRRRLPAELSDRPDLVIGTRSLVNSIDCGLIAEARAGDIDILTLAGSWDNFTTKGFFPFRARRTVVWNRKMADELDQIFAVPSDTVTIAGYPRRNALQRLAGGMSPAAYLDSLGHGRYLRFVLYSASYSELTRAPGETYPLEYQVIADVAAKLEAALPPDVCILLRLHPFSDPDGAEIFASLQRSFVFVPGRKDKYVERIMGPEDERHLARQIALSECMVSMASTMTIDALSLDKPVINTRFDPRPDVPFIHSNRRFYDFNHFRDLMKIVDLPTADTPEEVVAFVTDALAGRPVPRGNISAFEAHYVPAASERYPEIVTETILSLLGDRPGDSADDNDGARKRLHSAFPLRKERPETTGGRTS